MTTVTAPPLTLFSVGYGGRRASDLLAELRRHKVLVLVDVRLSPRSAVPGFSGASLARSLPAVGIEYLHEPALGNPEENREGFHSGVTAAHDRYKAHLMTARPALRRLAKAASTTNVAVLCAERDPARCHRSLVTAAVLLLSPTLTVSEI